MLPNSRNTNYAPDVAVKSADLNDIQDILVAQHNRPLHFAACDFGLGPNSQIQGGAAIRQIAAGAFSAFLDLSPWVIPGDTIKEFVLRYKNGNTPTAGNIALNFHRITVDTNALTNLQNSNENTNAGGALALRNVTKAVGHVVLADNFYFLQLTMDATGANDIAEIRGATIVLGV